jgi:glutaredoxin
MSTWRQKAIECAPELRTEFQETDLTPYTVFNELLVILEQAHLEKDNERLTKIYSFAAWCHKQKDKKLWNAVGVSFYEHLTDKEETYQQFTNWITKDIYFDIRDLLYQRASQEQIKQLDEFYRFKKVK